MNYKTISFLFVLLGSVQLLAAEEDLPLVLSQEIVDAVNEQRELNAELVGSWREKYLYFMDVDKTPKSTHSIREFLQPYFAQIKASNANQTQEAIAIKTPRTFRFTYSPFKTDRFLSSISVIKQINPDETPFTLGRGPFNIIDLSLDNPEKDKIIERCNTTLARVQLVFLPLGNGEVLMLDVFSQLGSELCTEDAYDKKIFAKLCKMKERLYTPMFLPTASKETIYLRISTGLLRITNISED